MYVLYIQILNYAASVFTVLTLNTSVLFEWNIEWLKYKRS